MRSRIIDGSRNCFIRRFEDNDAQSYAGWLRTMNFAAVLFNRGSSQSTISLVKFTGFKHTSAHVRVLIGKNDLGAFQGKFDATFSGDVQTFCGG